MAEEASMKLQLYHRYVAVHISFYLKKEENTF